MRHLRWIPAISGTRIEHLTLDEVFTRGHQFDGVETRDPMVRAALTRFLVSIAVLICREAGTDQRNAPEFAENGFPVDVVGAALDRIDDHLWLNHPDTPFLQHAGLDELAAAATDADPWITPAMLLPRTPGKSSKAWFDAAGTVNNPAELTPAKAAVALVTNWFYGALANYKTVVDGNTYKASGSVGTYGASFGDRDRPSLTFFHSGDTLTETILANVADFWLTDGTVPAYLSQFRLDNPSSTIAEWTFSGSAALIRLDETDGMFNGVIRGGFPHALPTALYKTAVAAQLQAAATNDPTRVWVDGRKAGTRELFSGISRTSSTAQNLRAWHVDAATPHLNHGILRPASRQLDILELSATNQGVVDFVLASWFTIESESIDIDATQIDVVRELANTVAKNPEDALLRALTHVHPPKKKNGRVASDANLRPAHVTAVGHLHSTLEPLLGTALAQIGAGVEPVGLIAAIQAAKLRAFDLTVRPILNTRTLPQIAAGRATLGHLPLPVRDADDTLISALVNEHQSRVTTDTGYRVAVRLGGGTAKAALPSVRRLPTHQQDGVIRGLSILAANPSIQHTPGLPLSRALSVLAKANDEAFTGASGISARVAQLIQMDGHHAAQTIEAFIGRLTGSMIGTNFHDVVHTLRHWDDPDHHIRTEHRLAFAYRFFNNPSLATGK